MLEIGCSAWQDPRGNQPGIHNIMGTVLTHSCQGLCVFARFHRHTLQFKGLEKKLSTRGEGGERKREGTTSELRNPSRDSLRDGQQGL